MSSPRAGYLFTRPMLMRATDVLATDVLMYAIPLLVLTTTGSASLTGVAFFLEWLPRLAVFAIGGPLVDRFRADRVFRAANLARLLVVTVAAVALGLLPGTGTLTTAVVLAVGALGGLPAQASFVAVETIGAETSRQAGSQAHRVQSTQIGIDQSALLVAPLLGGALLLAGPVCLLAVVAGLSLAAMLATTRGTDHPATPTVPQSVAASLLTGWRTVRGIPALAWLVVGLIAGNLATAVAQASAPITVMHSFGATSLTVGAIWSAAGVVSLAAVGLSRRFIDRHGLWPVGAAAAATGCLGCLGAALAPGLHTYAVAIGIMMAGEGAITVVLRTLRARLIPAAAFGSTLSVTIILVLLPMPLAGALVALLPTTALPALLLGCAVLQGLVMTLAFRGLWRHRASYRDPAPTTDPPPAVVALPAPAAAPTCADQPHPLFPGVDPMTSPHMLLLVGTGRPEEMRRYTLEAAAAEHPLLLIDSQPPTWQQPYVVDHEVADLHDPYEVSKAAQKLAERWDLAGILTFDEYCLTATARLTDHYGLPGNTPAAVGAARDKATSRQLFQSSDVPSALSTWVHSLPAAASAAERIGGYPVVLKPAAHAGSVGVVRVDQITDLPAAWAIASDGAAHQGPDGQGVLLEEFLDGEEISVETVTEHGLTTAVAVTRKSLGFHPYFLETGHCVTADDPLLATVAPIAGAALRAVGITHGVSHVEMRLTASGPRLIEVNARLGGDRIGELVRLATGVDLARAAAALACGQSPDLTPTRTRSAAIGMVFPPAAGTVTARALLDGDDTHVEAFHWLCDVGDQVTLTPSSLLPNNVRAGFGVVTGDSAEEACAHRSGLLERAVVQVAETAA